MTDSNKPVVVVGDDNEHVLRAMRVVLSRKYTVYTCDDPSKAGSLVRATLPDAVVLDVRMPTHDGFWVHGQIRSVDSTVPIIFNSAYQDALDQHDVAVSYKPFAFLPKGGDVQQFLSTVAAAVAHHRGQP